MGTEGGGRSGQPEPRGSQEAPLYLGEFLVGLSLVADLGMGLELGDSATACLIATRLAEASGLGQESEAHYTALLQHVGCTGYSEEAAAALGGDDLAVKSAALMTDFSDPRSLVGTYLLRLAPDAGRLVRLRAAGTAVTRSRQITAGYSRANCEVAAVTASRVGLGPGVSTALGQIFERWDGKGEPGRLAGDDIAAAARCAQVAQVAALFGRLGGVAAAAEAVRRRAGRTLDPGLSAAYLRLADELHGEVAGGDVLVSAVAAEPRPRVRVSAAGLDAACRAFGDAVDLKSRWFHGHSARVAELAEAAGGHLRLPHSDVVDLRRAGHLQDVGRVAVPTGTWSRPGPLTSSDWERVRLHAYHSERVLGRCPPLSALAPLAGMHHERLDGSGYHRQAGRSSIGVQARVLAAADSFAALTEARPHRPALTADRAAAVLRDEAAAGALDRDAVDAVLASVGPAVKSESRRHPRPDGLTDRQVEVVRLIAAGLSNRQIADRLVVSPRTAEHHVQDIYQRIGVSSRAAAALYAMEHDLLR